MNLRLEALKLAVASQGNPNKLGLAKEYLEFLEGPAVVAPEATPPAEAVEATTPPPAAKTKQGKQPK